MTFPLLKKVIIDCLLWLFASIFFGLLQLWLSIVHGWFKGLNINFNTYFLSGVLLFFCSGIIISSTYDIWLEENVNKNARLYVLFHIVFPVVLLLLIANIYLSTIDGKVLIKNIKGFQVGILIYSIIYSTCSKIQLDLVRFLRIKRERNTK